MAQNIPKGKFKILARKMIANGPTLEEEDIASRKNVIIGTIFALRAQSKSYLFNLCSYKAFFRIEKKLKC